jgi:hypothetical protein
MKNFDCTFGFSAKSYVRNTINLSWDKILLTSVISLLTVTSPCILISTHNHVLSFISENVVTNERKQNYLSPRHEAL